MRRRALMTNTSKPVTISVDLKGSDSVALCKINNVATESKTGESYTANITLLSDTQYRNIFSVDNKYYSGYAYNYHITNVQIVMNGVDVTSSCCTYTRRITNGILIKVTVNIPNITGDLEIKATAKCYVDNLGFRSDGTDRPGSYKRISAYLKLPENSTHIKLEMCDVNAGFRGSYACIYNANKVLLQTYHLIENDNESNNDCDKIIAIPQNGSYFRTTIGWDSYNTWDARRGVAHNKIYYSTDNGATWKIFWSTL